MQPLESIHDVLAVRVIVPTKADCYAAMRSICKQWQPVEGREKNYIRSPKANGYRSLHNVVITGDNVPIEVQIRTPQMHWEAEFGLAAHWRYKENVEGGWDMHVAWSRMMLLYCFGMHDYGKKTLSGVSAGSRLLREMTQGLMNTSGSAIRVRTCSKGAKAANPAPMSVPSARKGWMEHVKREMQPPKPLATVLVVVATAQCARIQELPAIMGASSVAELQSQGLLPGCNISQIRVNGVRARERAHPIYMGDIVTVVPDLEPAMLRNPLNVFGNIGAGDAPFGGWNNMEQMQREVFGIVLGALRGKPGAMGHSKGSARSPDISIA
jgi:Region found in RelA / SpoT proteins